MENFLKELPNYETEKKHITIYQVTCSAHPILNNIPVSWMPIEEAIQYMRSPVEQQYIQSIEDTILTDPTSSLQNHEA